MDIAERKNFKDSLKLHNDNLSNLSKETKTQKGSIAIFSYCHKIRDDEGHGRS